MTFRKDIALRLAIAQKRRHLHLLAIYLQSCRHGTYTTSYVAAQHSLSNLRGKLCAYDSACSQGPRPIGARWGQMGPVKEEVGTQSASCSPDEIFTRVKQVAQDSDCCRSQSVSHFTCCLSALILKRWCG